MTNFKNKTTLFGVRVFTYFCTLATVGLLLISSTTPVQAAYNAGATRYEDSLNNPHQQAVYTYNYENTAPDAAPGYFEIPLENIGSGAGTTDQYIEVTSITDTFPVDAVTFAPTASAQTITTDPAKAVYVAAGVLKVRVSPQTNCVMQAGGGCTMNNIPAAVPGKLTIKLSLKTSSPVTPTLLDGGGKIYFPNGYDINPIGWRINLAYVKTNDVLDPSVMPTATIRGQGGTGTPILNQPYTVVTSGIKAVDGNPLNAPNGTCKSTVGGTVYTGTGIVNGVCTINIPTNAPQTIPGGTVDLSDGGTPRPIVLNGIPYQTAQAGQAVTPLVTADIPGLTVTCTSATVNSTTTCTFNLPANKSLPADFKLGVGDANPAGTCTVGSNGVAVTCNNIPTGTLTGLQPINGQIGTGAKTDTGEKVQINPVPVQEGGKTITIPTIITDNDLTSLGFTCGNSNTVVVSTTTTCIGKLPPYKLLDSNNPLKLSIGNSGSVSDICTANQAVLTCNNVPTGTQLGSIALNAKIGNGQLKDTTQKVNVIEQNKPFAKVISEADIPNIGTGTDADPFKDLTCGNADTVNASAPTSCTGTLKDGWSIPSGFKLGIGVDPAGTCSQSGQVVTCLTVPVTSRAGSFTIVKAQIGAGSIIDTGKRVTVQAGAVVLARTGGAALIGAGLAIILALGAFVAFTRHNKINANNLSLDNQSSK